MQNILFITVKKCKHLPGSTRRVTRAALSLYAHDNQVETGGGGNVRSGGGEPEKGKGVCQGKDLSETERWTGSGEDSPGSHPGLEEYPCGATGSSVSSQHL